MKKIILSARRLYLPKKQIWFFAAICFLCYSCNSAYAQTPEWLWAKKAGGAYYDYGYSVATDASGNIYVAGKFSSSSISFGAYTLTNANTNDNTSDIFLAKYNPGGNALWAFRAGGADSDGAYAMATDSSGNVYLAGFFNSTSVVFGAYVLTNTAITGSDIFIVKFDSGGNVLWAKREGGTGFEDAYSIAADASGNISVAGQFRSPTLNIGSDDLTNAGPVNTYDIFLARYDTDGNALWAKSTGGMQFEWMPSVAVDVSGNTYLTGVFESSSITLGATTLTNANTDSTYDMFLAKYDSSGNVLWAKDAGGDHEDQAYDVAVDAAGNVYLAGSFGSFSISFGSFTLTNTNFGELFLTKYNSAGNVLWAKSAVGPDYNDIIKSVAVDAAGNIYVAGNFYSSTLTLGAATLTNSAAMYSEIFLAEYDSAGNVLWAEGAQGDDHDVATSISVDTSGNAYMTGYFESYDITFGSTVLMSSGYDNVFLAKSGIDITQINQLENPLNYTIYPNPASDKIMLTASENVVIEISNTQGQIIKIVNNSGTEPTVDITNFASGMYLIKIIKDNGITTKKFIKE